MRTRNVPRVFASVAWLGLVALGGCDDGSSGPGLRSWRVSPGTNSTDAPWGVAIDATGRVLVSEMFGHAVDVYTATGTPVTSWGSHGTGNGEFDGPKYVDTDGSGNVYVADPGNHRIQKFSSTGAYLTQWGSYGTGDGQFEAPTGIEVDVARGVVYVVDSGRDRIETFDLDGHYLAQWGSRGTGDGQFRFLDLEGGGNQGPEGDVALDAAGNLLVVDNWNHRVQRFAPNGTYLGQWGSAGSGPGLFLYPSGIAVAPDGTVVVTDNAQPHNEAGNVSRLMRFDASGAFLEEMRFPPIAGGPVQSLGVDIDSTGLVYVIQGDSVVVYDL